MSKWNNPLIIAFGNYMGLDPVNAIKKECGYLLNASEANSAVPVDIDKISEHLGLKDKKYLYGKIGASAYLEKTEEDSIKIRLNQDEANLYRFRFTIAHEIGHITIRNKINMQFSEKEVNLIRKYHFEEETLCQFAASELLLPEDTFLPMVQCRTLNNELIENMSRKFKVSPISVINRIAYLLPNHIAIYWNYRTSTNSNLKTLRVSWIFPKPQLKKVPFIPIDASAKDERFSPNIFMHSYIEQKSIRGHTNAYNFGSITGNLMVCAINPRDDNTLFPLPESTKKRFQFDLYSLIKY